MHNKISITLINYIIMHRDLLTPARLLTLTLSFIMFTYGLMGDIANNLFEFNRTAIIDGEYWRLLSCNLVHYGFAHLAMNIAAFLLVGLSLLGDLPARTYSLLFMYCSLCVGLGTFFGNEDLLFYRGLSGALHGLIVVGLFYNRWRNPGLSWVFIGLVFLKIIHEHQPGFQENQLQALLPVKVAVDAHLYGALAGLFWCWCYLGYEKYKQWVNHPTPH